MKHALICALAIIAVAIVAHSAGPNNPTPSVTLAWDPSPGTNAVAYYNIYYGPTSRTYTNTAFAGTNTTITISNLVRGSTYYFAATAVGTNNLESEYSSEVSCTIPAPPPPPTTLSVTRAN